MVFRWLMGCMMGWRKKKKEKRQTHIELELLPHDVIEHILERLDVKSLMKLKVVSKQWNSTIQCRSFQERQLIHSRRSGNPDVLLLSASDIDTPVQAMRTLALGSSLSTEIPTPWEDAFYNASNNSCDGLVCLNGVLVSNPNIIINPTTRWHRTFPHSSYQRLAMRNGRNRCGSAKLGFGRDKINGTYKLVWLYNSNDKLCLDNNHNVNTATICEVFDFTTNTWRYVVPASPYRILYRPYPIYFDGSLHWFTEGESMVLSLDLHTETFQVMSKTPFIYHQQSQGQLGMCNLDDSLCVSMEKLAYLLIWSFDSDQKIWKKMYSIDRRRTSPIHRRLCKMTLKPLAVVDEEKLLVSIGYELRIYDLITNSYELAYASEPNDMNAFHLCYFPSLISIL